MCMYDSPHAAVVNAAARRSEKWVYISRRKVCSQARHAFFYRLYLGGKPSLGVPIGGCAGAIGDSAVVVGD